MSLVKPRLNKYIETRKLVVEDCLSEICDCLVSDQEIDFDICNIYINGCKFVDVDFYMLFGVELIDCWFENCDLSKSEFVNTSLGGLIYLVV